MGEREAASKQRLKLELKWFRHRNSRLQRDIRSTLFSHDYFPLVCCSHHYNEIPFLSSSLLAHAYTRCRLLYIQAMILLFPEHKLSARFLLLKSRATVVLYQLVCMILFSMMACMYVFCYTAIRIQDEKLTTRAFILKQYSSGASYLMLCILAIQWSI